MACQLGAIPDRADGFNIKDAPAVAWCFTHQCRPNGPACMGARIAELEAAALTPDDLATVRALIRDHGFEYSLVSDAEKVRQLARKLGMDSQYWDE